MSRVLLLCPEPLGHGHPAGVGIRFIEIARALRADGHSVTFLTPDNAIVEGCTAGKLDAMTIRDASLTNDVAIVQGQSGNELFSHGATLPVAVDLYDPYVVEHLHYHDTHGEDVFVHNHRTLMRSLRRGDFFLCASEAQRTFYLGLLLATGRLNPVSYLDDQTAGNLIAVVPFGVPPPRDLPARDLNRPSLLFGGIYDWYDPILAIEATAAARARIPGLTLTFTRHPNAELTPQGAAMAAENYVTEKQWDNFVHFVPWTSYDGRLAFYDQFTAAILTFPSSVETDLAMRTRVLDYLWAGLPLITSPGRGTDEIIERHRAGRIVTEGTVAAFADAIIEMLGSRDRFDAMVAGAVSFARDNQWSRTLRPLLEFCKAPRFDTSRDAFTRLEDDVARLDREKQQLIAELGTKQRLLDHEAVLRETADSHLDSTRARRGELELLVPQLRQEIARIDALLQETNQRMHAINGERVAQQALLEKQQAAIDEQSKSSASLFAEIERLNGLLSQVYSSRAWKLQRAISRLRGGK